MANTESSDPTPRSESSSTQDAGDQAGPDENRPLTAEQNHANGQGASQESWRGWGYGYYGPAGWYGPEGEPPPAGWYGQEGWPQQQGWGQRGPWPPYPPYPTYPGQAQWQGYPDQPDPDDPATRAPRTYKDAWIWVVLAGLGFLVGQVVSAIVELGYAIVVHHAHTSSAIESYITKSPIPVGLLIVGELGLWVGFAGAVWLASYTRGTGSIRRDMGLHLKLWPDLPLGIVLGVAGQFLVSALYLPFSNDNKHFAHQLDKPANKLLGGAHGIGILGLILVIMVGAPLFEELLFRGVIMRALERLFGRWGQKAGTFGGILGSAILFGLAHVEPLQFFGLAAFGVILAVLAHYYKRLGPDMVAHSAFNGVALTVYLLGTHAH